MGTRQEFTVARVAAAASAPHGRLNDMPNRQAIFILIALATLTARAASAFEPAPHPPLERLLEHPPPRRACNNDWKLLHSGYAAWYADMDCPEFRNLINECRVFWWQDKGLGGSAARHFRAWCIAYVGLGTRVNGPLRYGRHGWKQVGFSILGDEDIERALQLARIFLGVPTHKRDPFMLRTHLNRVRQRWLRRRSKAKPTPADRRAAALEEAVRRARVGP